MSVSQLEPFPPFRLLIFQLGSYFLKKRKQKELRLPKSKREMMRSRLFSSPHCWTFWDDGNHPLAQEQILYIFPGCSFARDVGGKDRFDVTQQGPCVWLLIKEPKELDSVLCVLRCWSPSERTRIALINKRSSGCTLFRDFFA